MGEGPEVQADGDKYSQYQPLIIVAIVSFPLLCASASFACSIFAEAYDCHNFTRWKICGHAVFTAGIVAGVLSVCFSVQWFVIYAQSEWQGRYDGEGYQPGSRGCKDLRILLKGLVCAA